MSEAENFPFIVKTSSNEKKIVKQHKVFSIDEKLQIIAEVDTHMGTRVDLAALLGSSVSTLNVTVSIWSEIEKSYSCCRPSFYKECKSLKTSPLEELEAILLVWFKQARTTKAPMDGPHLKEKALHVAAHLGINSLQASNSWINHRKDTTWYKRLCWMKASL
jgi:hypothetical protein